MSDTLNINIKSKHREGMKPVRIVKSLFNIVTITLLIVVVAMLSGCKKSTSDQQGGTGETLRFVWLADSRGDSLQHPVNYEVLNAIISQIGTLSPKPSFMIFGGDMSYRGYIKPSYTFQAWKDLFAPLTGNGIPLYTSVGNHELYYEHSDSGFMLGNQQQFQDVFSENPSNGPAGYEHLAYSFTSPGGSSFFAVLDAYYLTHDSFPLNLGGNIDAAQMSWLRAQVAQTKATHKFLFIHTPYYYVSDDPEEPSAANQTYTGLWAFLDSNKFDFYACGHSHLFSRRTIDSSVAPNPQTTPPTPSWQNNVVQLLNGTCGAGPDAGTIDPAIKTAWNVHNDAKTYYFSVVDISGNTVTVNSYSGYKGAYSVFDTFTINK
ncbi:MAG: metallophosphoesterase [Bacteroidetes bacterium]|nr:metallophosphoesterase [Bacteroidota bacterium]